MRSAWLEVDLAAYRHNLQALARVTGVPALAVVKANAYGHGIAAIAREAVAAGCAGVGVALVAEGVHLREQGQPGRIVLLAPHEPDEAGWIAGHRLEPFVSDPGDLKPLAGAAAKAGVPVSVHVHVDTGMSRGGVSLEGAPALLEAAAGTPGTQLAGICTHFASADEADPAPGWEQWKRFEPLVRLARERWPGVPIHAANSAAAVRIEPSRLSWTRPGLLTYGVAPGPFALPFEPRPVAALKARVVEVQEVPPGTTVSYGGTWTALRTTRLGLLTLGYADGLPWRLSGGGYALVGGRRAPYRGRVCMDQVLIDLTGIPQAGPGSEVVLLGSQGGDRIEADDLARIAGTIPYEILTGLSARLPRLFLEAGG